MLSIMVLCPPYPVFTTPCCTTIFKDTAKWRLFPGRGKSVRPRCVDHSAMSISIGTTPMTGDAFSVAECARTEIPAQPIQPPREIPAADWQALWEHGGFPEPFLRRESRFTRRWRSLRNEQLSRQDLREIAHITELGVMETLMQLL